jgi:hypothetical protein
MVPGVRGSKTSSTRTRSVTGCDVRELRRHTSVAQTPDVEARVTEEEQGKWIAGSDVDAERTPSVADDLRGEFVLLAGDRQSSRGGGDMVFRGDLLAVMDMLLHVEHHGCTLLLY